MRRLIVLLAAVAGLAAMNFLVSGCDAAETLRWSLTAGEQLDYELGHTVKVSLDDDQTEFELRQSMHVKWKVQDVGSDGTAVVHQSISRIVLELDHVQQELKYDSADGGEPRGLAALAGSILDALRETPLRFELTPRGVVKNVEVAPEVLESMSSSSLAGALKNFASEAGLRQLFFTGVPQLPQDVLEDGQQWATSGESMDTFLGQHRIRMNYRYEGREQREDNELAVIQVRPEVEFAEPLETTPKVRPLASNGEVLFDVAHGRLVASRWELELQSVVNVGGQATKGVLEQNYSFKLSGADTSDAPSDSTGLEPPSSQPATVEP